MTRRLEDLPIILKTAHANQILLCNNWKKHFYIHAVSALKIQIRENDRFELLRFKGVLCPNGNKILPVGGLSNMKR